MKLPDWADGRNVIAREWNRPADSARAESNWGGVFAMIARKWLTGFVRGVRTAHPGNGSIENGNPIGVDVGAEDFKTSMVSMSTIGRRLDESVKAAVVNNAP